MKKQRKSPKQKKQKSNTPAITDAELKRLLLNAGFVFVNDCKAAFGKPAKDLVQGETIIFPEGARRGIPVK